MPTSEPSSRRRRSSDSGRPRPRRSRTPSTAPESRMLSARWRRSRVVSGILVRRRPQPGRRPSLLLLLPGTLRFQKLLRLRLLLLILLLPREHRPHLPSPRPLLFLQRLLLHLHRTHQILWRARATQRPRSRPAGVNLRAPADEVAEDEAAVVAAEAVVVVGEVRRAPASHPQRRQHPPHLPPLEARPSCLPCTLISSLHVSSPLMTHQDTTHAPISRGRAPFCSPPNVRYFSGSVAFVLVLLCKWI